MPLERPGANDLLAIARSTLLAELLPALPEPQQLAARMVANAMAIAARAACTDPNRLAALRQRAAALVGDEAEPWRALAAAIRAGRFDPGRPERASAAALLADLARLRCEVSAPRALGGG